MMFPLSSDRHVREYAKAASRYYEILRQREESKMTNKDHIERTKRMIEVMQAYVDGEKIESSYGAELTYPSWDWQHFDYRIVKTPDTINWDHVAPEFKYMARDEDGLGYLYTEKPNMGLEQHTTPTKGRMAACDIFDSYRKGTVAWKESLVIRPGCE